MDKLPGFLANHADVKNELQHTPSDLDSESYGLVRSPTRKELNEFSADLLINLKVEYEKKQAQVKADIEAYIASGGKIHVIETEPCDTIVTRVGEIYEQRF